MIHCFGKAISKFTREEAAKTSHLPIIKQGCKLTKLLLITRKLISMKIMLSTLEKDSEVITWHSNKSCFPVICKMSTVIAG